MPQVIKCLRGAASRHSSYWLLVSPKFIEGEKQISEDEKRLGNLINLGKKNYYMFFSLKKMTRMEILNYLRVSSVTYAVPVSYSKFKNLCGDRPSYVILMNHNSRITDRLMCIKHLSKKFPSLLFGQALNGSFTEIHFSSRGHISAADVDKAVKEYLVKEQKKNELEVSVAASSCFNRTGLSKSAKGNFNRKFHMFMLDTDEQLEKIKQFCEKNKNLIAAIILYENLVCLIRFSVPTEVKTLISSIRENTGIVLQQKDVYKMKYDNTRTFLQCFSFVKKVYAHGNILEKATKSNGRLLSKTFFIRKDKEFTKEQLLYMINNPKIKKLLLNNTNCKGAIWCWQADDNIWKNNKILHDIKFESITDMQFYRFDYFISVTKTNKLTKE